MENLDIDVEATDTGFTVNFSRDGEELLGVGVHSDQASNEEEAIAVAKPQLQEYLEKLKDKETE